MPDLICLDTETSGLTPPIGVVELAYLRVNEALEVTDEHCCLVNPGRPIEPGATGVHGIVDADVANAISLEDAIAPIADREIVVVGHNCSFDIRLIEKHVNIVGSVCTLALARQHVKGSANHKLGTLAKHLGLPDLGAHRALGDAYTALNLLKYILHYAGLTMDQVITRQQKPRMLLTMPWGKHAGATITQVPWGYRNWLLNKGNLDQDMRYTLEKLKDMT